MRWATLAELRLPDMSCGMQEICQAEVTHPLTVPESRAPTLRQRKPRQIQTKVISFISSCACYPHFVVTFIGALCCELESASSTSNTSLLCSCRTRCRSGWSRAGQAGMVGRRIWIRHRCRRVLGCPGRRRYVASYPSHVGEGQAHRFEEDDCSDVAFYTD